MLSVVLYGRNDSYGYNLHKRAALSINCISQVLTDPDDELLFVDYNSPDDYPTFPEAIQDTLTDQARNRLRILRVRPWMHERFRLRSHLHALEPIARNVALRRSNPSNRWILSTNTDMIFVPHQGQSLSDLVGNLPRGLYHLPRFELPESFWELFDRHEPAHTIDRIRDCAKIAHLNEVVEAADFIRFDGPGDFQLMPRDDVFRIHGFHEGMLLGWHVDSNIAKRLFLLYGETRDLMDGVFGYHCDHTRQVTPAHRKDSVSNDLRMFVSDVSRPDVPDQAETWGLPDVAIEEVRLARGRPSAYLNAIRAGIPEPQTALTFSGYQTASFDKVTYGAAHVLPFLVDIFVNALPGTRIGWVGSSPELFEMFRTAWESLDRQGDLIVFEPHGEAYGRHLPGNHVESLAVLSDQADALIFDYNGFAAGAAGQPEELLLAEIRSSFKTLVELERERLRGSQAPRRFVAVNAIHNAFESLTSYLLHVARTPFSARIRHGFVVRIDQPGRTWADDMLVGESGIKQNGFIRTSGGRHGIVMHGPVGPTQPGGFTVTLEFACSRILRPIRPIDAIKGHARVKLIVDGTVVARRRLSRSALYRGRLDIDFESPKKSVLEMRLWTSGSHEFEVRNILMRQVM